MKEEGKIDNLLNSNIEDINDLTTEQIMLYHIIKHNYDNEPQIKALGYRE